MLWLIRDNRLDIMPTKFLRISIVLLSFTSIGCILSAKPISYEDDKQVALQKIQDFHEYYNEGEFNAIYGQFDERVKSQQSEEQFIEALKALHAKAGDFDIQRVLKADVKSQASFRIVHIILESIFKNKTLFEEFACLTDGSSALFDFYGQPDNLD